MKFCRCCATSGMPPTNMVDHCFNEITAWKNICLTNDPTRGWISGDGEWDASGACRSSTSTTAVTATCSAPPNPASHLAVGETSMAYYGTPKQVAKFNGDRTYESDLGRMEGLAYECYGLLAMPTKIRRELSKRVQPGLVCHPALAFRQGDLTKAPSLDEGVSLAAIRKVCRGCNRNGWGLMSPP